jgi:hypothetical protein
LHVSIGLWVQALAVIAVENYAVNDDGISSNDEGRPVRLCSRCGQ